MNANAKARPGPGILAMNHNDRNLELLTEFLQKAGYGVLPASLYEEFDATLAGGVQIDAALIDITSFDDSIWARCQRLRTLEIPFVVISPRQSAAIEHASMMHGAESMVVKPLVIKELLAIVKSLLRETA
jgi:DNA-binding response OmpR family regulator